MPLLISQASRTVVFEFPEDPLHFPVVQDRGLARRQAREIGFGQLFNFNGQRQGGGQIRAEADQATATM